MSSSAKEFFADVARFPAALTVYGCGLSGLVGDSSVFILAWCVGTVSTIIFGVSSTFVF